MGFTNLCDASKKHAVSHCFIKVYFYYYHSHWFFSTQLFNSSYALYADLKKLNKYMPILILL